MYSYKLCNQKTDCRIKGIKQYNKRSITHEDYKNAYDTWNVMTVQQRNIQSTHHQVRTITMNKVALNTWEDKRC